MERVQLNNGLRIVMEKMPTFRSVTFGIWIKTGSRNESLVTNGISHFIEHMLFKGTKRYDAKRIAEIFDGIGGNVNAFTSKEYTCFYAKVLDEHLEIALDILSDMFFDSLLDPDELAKEKNVILEEISMYEDDPDDLVHDLVTMASYGNHPLAYPILGTEERLKPMGPEQLRLFMKDRYTVENTVISIAGNIDDSVVPLLEKYFGDFDVHGPEPIVTAPVFKGEVIFRKKKTEQNHICMNFPGGKIDDPRYYAMVLLNNALGGGMSSRLFQEIREKRGLAYSVYSYYTAHADSGLFTIYAGTAPKQTGDVFELTHALLQDLKQNGLTAEELEQGKQQLKGSLILSLESTSSIMNRLGKNEIMLQKHNTVDETIRYIEEVTMEDIRSVIDDMFAEPYALAMVGGSDKSIAHVRRDELVH
ncbi:M16 family metallopeptidase [Paenibacillus dauci]|uniref:M16 family metallopeptidase n=1 Tax=Paenibacillus dauci TaxID=1567106 RepID=UPI00061913B8|nr:pitrilysin family protein [Paenibacillus dauci]